MNKVVVTTGYMGSGSSAMTDLLSELDGFMAPNSDFEYVFLHCPNGFFDLEEKLTSLNNANRSDEAIRSFYEKMKYLYETPEKKLWIAGYKKRISQSFMSYVLGFLRDIGVTEVNGVWYEHQKPCYKYNVKYLIWKIKLKLKIKENRVPSNYDCMKLAFPTKTEFFDASKRFLTQIYKDLGISNYNLIMDQLILPHNICRAVNYFDVDDTFFYVIDRDPRDVFILNKYYWTTTPLPYPTDVVQFCELYKKIRKSEIIVDGSNIRRIHFEDLIYNYDKCLKIIYQDLGITVEKHVRKKMRFDPDISINNTQTFRKSQKYFEEAKYIENNLEEYLYDFPYEFNNNDTKIF